MSKSTNDVILEVKGLKKNFGSNQVLKGVDIEIHMGEVIAIIGPSGCGKSTFIRCLNFLEQPDDGEIIYHGQDLMALDKKAIHEALKGVDIIQLPMTAIMDMKRVADEIVASRVNVLMGMPTYLLRLFSEQEETLKAYGGIDLILYGGEHFDKAQAEYLKETFNIKRIASITYGCNEIGSMGYACEYCEGGVHHVAPSKYLEILKLDKDEPVEAGEIGRLVWTPVDQENTPIKRYEIGDLGRFITEPCKCGRLSPRFELLGRFGDIFKFATNYVNYKNIKSIFSEKMNYNGWLQVILSYDGISVMTICVEDNFAYGQEEAMEIMKENYEEIKECVTDKTGEIRIIKQNRDAFELSSGGGKVRSVIDRRNCD